MVNLTLLNIIQIEKNVHATVKTFFFSANILSYYNTIYFFFRFFLKILVNSVFHADWIKLSQHLTQREKERERD
jgi:hypothetical protein